MVLADNALTIWGAMVFCGKIDVIVTALTGSLQRALSDRAIVEKATRSLAGQ